MADFWTDERIARLKQLHATGMRASEIAARIGDGTTKNAVLGKIHRLGLSAPTGRAGPRTPRNPPPPPAQAPPARPHPEQPKSGEPVHIADLRECHCRWVIGAPKELTFCGKPRANRMWCAEHVEVGYQPRGVKRTDPPRVMWRAA